ncbi:MAG: S8 family serine peptidase, partial [Actinomycetota bacterium]
MGRAGRATGLPTAARLLVGGLVFALAVGAAVGRGSGPAAAQSLRDPIERPDQPIPDQYIVVLKRGTNAGAAAQRLTGQFGGEVQAVYSAALEGFSVRMTDAQAQALARHPLVKVVSQDGVVSLTATQSPATWGLDRVDQAALPLSNSYRYDGTGAGVTAYVIDTGIRFSSTDFGGRAVTGADMITSGGNAADCNGHGTHVAGTVGGTTYGVAKQVTLVPVRVLNCSGSGSAASVIA